VFAEYEKEEIIKQNSRNNNNSNDIPELLQSSSKCIEPENPQANDNIQSSLSQK